MNTRAFKVAMIYSDKNKGLTFLQGDRGRCIRAPHLIGFFGDDGSIVGFRAVGMPHALGSLQTVFAHQSTDSLFGTAYALTTQLGPHFSIAFPMKRRSGQHATNVIDQLSIRARTLRPWSFRWTGNVDSIRVGVRSMCIHRRTRLTPNLADSLQPVTFMRGDRTRLAHGFDRRRGKGSPSSIRAILCSKRSLAIVSSPTLACNFSIRLSRSSPTPGRLH